MSEEAISDMPPAPRFSRDHKGLIRDMHNLYVHDLAAPERCGFVVDGKVVEVKNICHEPADGFDISADDLLKYEGRASASWHTHTGTDYNLTRDDLASFLNYPHLHHYIIGSDGVACYAVDQGRVVRAATYPSSRHAEEHLPRAD